MSAQGSTFVGTFTPRLDDKGRLTLPAKFRRLTEDGIVLTRGQEQCVYGWTPSGYEQLVARVRQLPLTSAGARNFQRMFFGAASEEMPDKQGRVSVAPKLRAWAELDRECTVVGVMDRFEIWATERWEQFEETESGPFSDLSEEVIAGIF